jgi:hypothetical protein
LSSFTIGATSITFEAVADLGDELGVLEEITVGILIPNATAWGALATLRTPQVSVRSTLSGSAVVDFIGPGPGALSIDNLDTHSAILTKLSRSELEPGTLRSKGSATFLIVG